MENSISFQMEANKTEIRISKIITGITIIYIFTFIIDALSQAQHATPLTSNSNTFPHLIYELLRGGLFCFQVFLIIRLLYPKKSKIEFINFKRGFHPIFIDSNQKSNLRFCLIVFGLFNFVFLLCYTLLYFNFINDDLESLFFVYHSFIHLMIIWSIKSRNDILNSVPVEFMKFNKLRLRVIYEDYINHKIADDEPHLTLKQNFDVSLKSLPRNASEKNLIEIKNPKTPINPALVYKIEDYDLADALRNGFILRAKLIEIKEEGNLEIELSLKEKGIESD